MNNIDIIISLFLIFGILKGFWDGFFVALASLLGLIVGIYGAIHFSHYVGDFLFRTFSWSEQKTNLAAFAITFILIVVAIHLAGRLLTQIANFAALSIINKILGAVFGLFRAAFIVSVILLFFNELGFVAQLIPEETKDDSVLYRPVEVIAPSILPSILKNIKEKE